MDGGPPRVGLAYSGYVVELLRRHPAALDFVEIPFELLRHDASVLATVGSTPVVLHCASLNVAGSVPPGGATLGEVRTWARRTRTPWVGEHLSFITADRGLAGPGADAAAAGEPYNLGFTVSPPMNAEAVERVTRAASRYTRALGLPLLLENPPLYFRLPGTTMSQTEFIGQVCRRAPVRLLLDLTHFHITACNMGFEAAAEVERLPLERVDEVHLSGASAQEGRHWDDHASRVPGAVFDLLAAVVRRATPRAVTLEYNWSSRFPLGAVLADLRRVRALVARG